MERTAILTACPSPVGILTDDDGNEIKVRCNKPSCPFCGRIYKKKFLDNVRFGTEQIQKLGKRWRFVTLTTSYLSDQSKFSKYWAKFRAILAKHGYGGFDFCKVTEINDNGLRHIHAMVSVFMPFNLIRYAWEMATEKTANRVNIKAVKLNSPAGYMAKYMTKAVTSALFNKGERRYTFSRSFPRIPKPEKDLSKHWTFKSFVTLMYEKLDAGTWYENNDYRASKMPDNPFWGIPT